MNSNYMNIGIDIGGSVIKIVYPKKIRGPIPTYINIDCIENNVLLKIPIQYFDQFLQFLKENWLQANKTNNMINITGGGAYMYEHAIGTELGIKYNKLDEIVSLVAGFDYVLKTIPDEVFTFGWQNKSAEVKQQHELGTIYPCMLVNIGSGVSILRIDDSSNFKRVSGTSLGGGTFMGLCKMLTGIDNFNDVVNVSQGGDNKKIDLSVGDIYGGDCEKLQLKSYVIASNFGKIATSREEEFDSADIIRSLIYMFSDNLSQIVFLCCQQHPDIKHVFFAGSFMELGPTLWKKISYGMEFWSLGQMEAKFLHHSGYLGAIGAFIHT